MQMRAELSFLVALAALIAVSCAPPVQEPTEPAIDIAAEEQAIRELSMQWMEASNARDGAAIDNVMAPDITTIYDGKILEGLAAVQASREADWAESPDAVVSWTTTAVEVASSGDLAYERGNWTLDRDGPGEAIEEHGEYLTIWKKEDGRWQVVADAGSTLKAEEESAEAEESG